MSFLVLLVENLLFPFGALVLVLGFLFSPRRKVLRSLRDELRERFGGVSSAQRAKLAGRKVLWVHAASAGEVAAVRGLLERIKQRKDPPAIVITTTTMTGREAAGALASVDLACLAPLDSYLPVHRFLDGITPYALLLVETELWPQTIALAARRGVKVALANGRLSERSFSRYSFIAPFLRPFLRMISLFAAQSDGDASRFARLGAGDVRVLGNMKYDQIKSPSRDRDISDKLAALGWGDDPVWVAGSTHPVEEEQVIEAFIAARVLYPKLRLALAPRHPERALAAAKSLEVAGLSFSAWSGPAVPGDVLLVDVLGVLPRLYPFAAFSFVGGTLVPVGGHNLLEPAIARSAVLFGPHTQNTADVARLLESAGCGFCAEDAGRLGQLVLELLSDPARCKQQGELARKTAESLQGAVARTLDYLGPVLLP